MYQFDEKGIRRFDQRTGEEVMLSNFVATIETETVLLDGREQQTLLTVVGELGDKVLPPVTVTTDEFASMNWVTRSWGSRAVIMPTGNAERHLRTAIQMHSEPEVKIVGTHTGWVDDDTPDPAYLHADGGIRHDGFDDQIEVRLPKELRRYRLPRPGSADHAKKSLTLLKLGPPEITWPLLAATYRAAVGNSDFAIHLAGQTGTYKSEAVSLFQSHYGDGLDARHLPASWSSTANALEALAYRAKDALMVIDDFVPYGTSWQVRQYQKTADQLIRGQGNQAGRARLSDVSNLQETMYPRGIILSTGEDIPEGHSVRARMMILDLTPGDISTAALTSAQKARKSYPAAMAAWIQWLAEDLDGHKQWLSQRAEQIRDNRLDIGHTRTPAMIGQLQAAGELMLLWMADIGAIRAADEEEFAKDLHNAILVAGKQQHQYLHAADPTDAFVEAIRSACSMLAGHFRTKNGGIPAAPELLGWTQSDSSGDVATYKAHGQKLGWVDWDTDELLLDASNAFHTIKRFAGGKLTLTKQTLFKRLKDSGLLTRVDETRKRNTIRHKCEGHTRQVLALSISQVLDQQETY